MLPEEQQRLLDAAKYLEQFSLSVDDYARICEDFRSSMQRGLDPEQRSNTSIKMYPTYVAKIPTGKGINFAFQTLCIEKGRFLALDLGGTNYRIILVTLSGRGHVSDVTDRTYAVPPNIMTGASDELFNYLSFTLNDFLTAYGLQNEEIELGFTFSFPCTQMSLNEATLVKWTKGFSISGVEGQDVSALLQKGLQNKNLKIKCTAVVNDTVGTLASCALEEPRTAIGLIVGTGTNAAYVEACENIKTIDCKDAKEMVINTEWGAYGDAGELKQHWTKYDELIDKESINPGKQIFEKMASGMYLGEIIRHILIDLTEKGLIFHGVVPPKLKKQYGFRTKFISDPERDPDELYYGTHYMLTTELGVEIVDPADPKIVRMVCQAVVRRAAYLIGTGIAAILRQMKRPMVVVGVDGSLYRFHPKFHTFMTEMIDKLKPNNTMFILKLSADGSGRGAAAIAAANSDRAKK